MISIYKYTIKDKKWAEVMPRGARILSVGAQRGQICLWALVDTEAPEEARCFRVYGTGRPVEVENLLFIGTVILGEGDLVWHIFEAR